MPSVIEAQNASSMCAGTPRQRQVSGPFEVENCRIGGLTDVALDKTGTVTTGKPALTDVVPLGMWREEEVLRMVAGVKRASEHPRP
jgi:high-affinity K+ transport system ATPase subunit B